MSKHTDVLSIADIPMTAFLGMLHLRMQGSKPSWDKSPVPPLPCFEIGRDSDCLGLLGKVIWARANPCPSRLWHTTRKNLSMFSELKQQFL